MYRTGDTAMKSVMFTATGFMSGLDSGRLARLSASPIGMSQPGLYVMFKS